MQKLDDGIWTFDAPHRFYGVHMGVRMTVVRLSDGGLWVHSPIELGEVRPDVDALGDVAYIVAPNRFHHVYAGPWKEAYPEAELWGAPGLPDKRGDLDFDHVLTEDPSPWSDDLEEMLVEGSSMLREVAFYHRASRTLITADLFINEHDPKNFISKAYYWLNGVLGKAGLSRMIKIAYDDKAAARASFRKLRDWDFERIVISHGEIVEGDAQETLRRITDEAF